MTGVLYVVAPNPDAYELWRQGAGLHLNNSVARYVRSAKTIKGERDVPILFLKHWQSRPDWRQVYNRAIAVGRRPS